MEAQSQSSAPAAGSLEDPSALISDGIADLLLHPDVPLGPFFASRAVRISRSPASPIHYLAIQLREDTPVTNCAKSTACTRTSLAERILFTAPDS